MTQEKKVFVIRYKNGFFGDLHDYVVHANDKLEAEALYRHHFRGYDVEQISIHRYHKGKYYAC